jgi:LacI family transcriptional regulator
MTTLKDIARAAGVSTATVSRAIARRGSVSQALQDRVMAAAKRLDYKPNLAARALASRRSGLIGLVASDLEEPAIARVVASAQRALDARGYAVLLAAETTGAPPAATALAGRGVEALLFVGRSPASMETEVLEAEQLPWVAIADAQGGDPRCLAIGRVDAAELACRYLLEVGHRGIAILTRRGPSWGGLTTRLKQAGVAVEFVEVPRADPAASRSAVQALLDAPARVTAIVCASDADGMMAARECAARGLRIPEEISVVGFGDDPLARWGRPALTTVRPSWLELGRRAADAVEEAIAGRTPAPYVGRVKLIVRETTERP